MSDVRYGEETSEPRDWILRFMLELLNRSDGNQIPITLTVGGTLITGMMIGVKDYYCLLGSQMRNMMAGTVGETLETFYRSIGDKSQQQAKEEPQDEAQLFREKSGPNFVHLKNAQIATPQGLVPTDSTMLWRGRVSQVQGFSLGRVRSGR